jgi:dihydrolipoamide dehydrogenase
VRLVVIGAGPGGEAAAKRAASAGALVTLVEKGDLGGLCLNRGCIPSKALLEGGRLLRRVRAAGAVLTGTAALDWTALQKKKARLVEDLRSALAGNYKRLGVKVLQGVARFTSPNAAVVEGPGGAETIAFDAAVLATGSAPYFPEPFGTLRGDILDSDGALALPAVPSRLLVVGGGAVGCEFAGFFQELGSRVTLVEMKDQLLPGEDAAVVRVLQGAFERRGMAVVLGAKVTRARRDGGLWRCEFSQGAAWEGEEVLVCVGRRPALDGLGLTEAGIVLKEGRPGVDEFLRTSVPTIYAVGDVNGLSLLAHAAARQGETAADHALGKNPPPYDNSRVPRCLYTWPEVASVGDWTYTAQARGVDVQARRFFFKGSPKALAEDDGDGFLQILAEKSGDRRILGAQIVGPHATELIHVFSMALEAGMTVDRFRRVIFAHPTLAEGVREALDR